MEPSAAACRAAKIMPSFLAPVIPKSACEASPIPFTAQPSTATSIGSVVALQALLDLGHDGVHVELEAAARRARDQHRPALAKLEGLQDLPGDLHLLLGMEGRERDADRVADALRKQRAQAHRRLQRAGPARAALGDAEVQRVVDPLREQAVGGDRVRDVGRLDRHLEVLEVEALHQRRRTRPPRSPAPRRARRAPARGGASAASRS